MEPDHAPFLRDLVRKTRPPGLLLSARFDPAALGEVDLPVALPDALARAVPHRRAEYLAGRTLCHMAQRALGLAPRPVGRAADRAPIWPEGITGSISHSRDAVCVWLAADPTLSLGLDLEMIPDAATCAVLAETAFDARELAVIGHDPHRLVLAFSAKEAVFKALAPQIGAFFGFDAARIDSISPQGLQLSLCETLSADWPSGSRLDIHWRHALGGLQTFVVLPLRRKVH